MHLKMSPAKWSLFRLCLNEFMKNNSSITSITTQIYSILTRKLTDRVAINIPDYNGLNHCYFEPIVLHSSTPCPMKWKHVFTLLCLSLLMCRESGGFLWHIYTYSFESNLAAGQSCCPSHSEVIVKDNGKICLYNRAKCGAREVSYGCTVRGVYCNVGIYNGQVIMKVHMRRMVQRSLTIHPLVLFVFQRWCAKFVSLCKHTVLGFFGFLWIMWI